MKCLYGKLDKGSTCIKISELKENKPEDIIKFAVKGMLPKNKLQKEFLKNLFIHGI